MNRLNLHWFAIAALGSMLVHVLAIGWWLANSLDSQGGARGVSVSIVSLGVSSNTADLEATNPNNTVPSVDERARLYSAVEHSDVNVVSTIAPSDISELGSQAVVNNVANGKIAGLAENADEADPITRATHELADLTESADSSPATAEPPLSLATLPVTVNEVSATEDTLIKDSVSSLANQGDDTDRPPSYDLGSDRNPKPKYPYIAKKRGWQGDVLIGVDVKKDGWPQRVRVIESSGFGLLDNAAVATIRDTWQFQPAQHLRRAVIGYTEVPISFRLN